MGPLISAEEALRAFPLEMANTAIDAKRLDVQAKIDELQTLDLHLVALKGQMYAMFSPHTVQPRACPDTQKPRAMPATADAG